ncbi:MAG: GNAT family N-acetyltransferase [Treponema sp.]|nr:GNAT family N-acetyltransferase [Treponema sp.]
MVKVLTISESQNIIKTGGKNIMEIFCDFNFRRFEENDVKTFSPIMKQSFDKDFQIHLGKDAGGPPGYNNGDFLRKWYFHNGACAYAVYKNDIPVGAICVWINDNQENYLGNVFIDPDYQNKGIGLIIWNYIEQKYPETKVWRTETPGFSIRNHYFYVNKCGFKIIKIENPKDKYDASYILEKQMK